MSLAAEAFVSQIAAAEPWPESATLYQPLKEDQILLSDCASSLAVQAYLRMCGLPVEVVCKANAEYMSPSGKIPFIHVGNQVVSELGPIVQFTKAKGHSLSDGLDDVQRAEMKAYMELVNNMLLTAELYIQWCDDATAAEVCLDYLKKREKSVFIILTSLLIKVFFQITRPRYSSPYSWPLSSLLAYLSAAKLSPKDWEHNHSSLINSRFLLFPYILVHMFISTEINTKCMYVTGRQNWMLWCSATSSPSSPPDSRAQSWQRGSRATATCCPSAGASNRLTLKTRAPEGWK
ncbi:unnamed protein product [Tetraodon nigroviridis]|uniref:(spotted green pufferfish) hypothetical protein n=1 Tax=Tetraodon nigroviridis TaxID=99883 RepID=Q4SGB1_TETNG|nr:unnamed protein product [Tetraodon nigroviridis]